MRTCSHVRARVGVGAHLLRGGVRVRVRVRVRARARVRVRVRVRARARVRVRFRVRVQLEVSSDDSPLGPSGLLSRVLSLPR